jgi:PAS domain S-box-containing protein
LSVSKAKYKDLIDNINDVVLTTGSDGTITFVSGVAERMLGYNPSEVLGRHIWDFVSPRDTSVTKNRFETLRNGHAQENEYSITTKNGEKRWIRTSSRPVYEEGTLKCCYVVVRDITPSKKAEDELRESEKRFRRLSEAAFEAIVVHEGGVILSANDQYFEMFGYEPEELLGKQALPLTVTPEGVESIRKEIARGGMGPYDVIGLKKDGTRFPIEIRAREVEYEGRMVRVAISMDVTERKQAEEVLKENEEKYRQLFEMESDALLLVEAATGRILEANRASSSFYGYSHDELLTMSIAELSSEPEETLHSVATGERHIPIRYHRKKNGTLFPVETMAKNFMWRGGEVRIAAIRDITSRVSAEKVRADLESHLWQIQKMEAIGTLAGGIAHDFNNILTGIMGYSEMALMDLPQNSEAKTCVELVIKGGHRARELVRQILTFSRRSEASPKPVKVGSLINETVKFLRASLPATIQIQANTEAEKDVVLADPTHIHQIIMNLCTNAHHAMRDKGGVLGIEVKNVQIGPETVLSNPAAIPGRYLMLVVSDTGCGIDPANLRRIFEPYFTTKEKDEGTGLGLAVVHGIVTQLGGAVTVRSEPGKGSEFRVLIPVIEEEEMPLESFGPIPKGTGRILFVDDEADICDLARRMLQYLGYEVDVRVSGLEALEAFKYQPNKFDLIITDMTMPHMTGERLAKEVMLLRPDLPVILCTGFSELMPEERAMSLGIKARLLKPLIMRDIAEIIHKVLFECRGEVI